MRIYKYEKLHNRPMPLKPGLLQKAYALHRINR